MITPKITRRTWNNKDGSKGTSYQVIYGKNAKDIIKISCKSKEEAQLKLAEIINGVQTDTYIKSKDELTFCDVALMYLEGHCRNLKETTQEGYWSAYNLHFKPFFGKYKAKEISRSLGERFIAEKKEEGQSEKSLNNFLIILKAMFNYALDDDKINKNPFKKIKPFEVAPYKFAILNLKQIANLLDKSKDNLQAFTLLYIAVFTGIRQGELRALKWESINYDEKYIYIHKTRSKNNDVKPKSKKSVRYVRITDDIIELLKIYEAKYGKRSDYVFVNSVNKTWDSKGLLRHLYYPYKISANLPDNVRFHDLRHSYASNLIAQGISIDFVSESLGHHSTAFTQKTYVHIMEETYKRSLKALAKITMTVNEIRKDNVIPLFPNRQKIQQLKSLNDIKMEFLKENVIENQSFSSIEEALKSPEYISYIRNYQVRFGT